MKNYDEFVNEQTATISPEIDIPNIDRMFNSFSQEIKDFIKNKVFTKRKINFSQDTDDELLTKRSNNAYKEYFAQIDTIFQKRFQDMSKEQLEDKLRNTEYSARYGKIIKNILETKQSQQAQLQQPIQNNKPNEENKNI